MPVSELKVGFKEIKKELRQAEKQKKFEKSQRKKGILTTAKKTHTNLLKHQQLQLTNILAEERDAKIKAKQREVIIQKEFKRVQSNIAGVIKKQKKNIFEYFGPLLVERKSGKYKVLSNTEKKVDLSQRKKICLPYEINVKMLRCVKDKIEAGVYVVSCQVIDRLGGSEITYNPKKQLKDLEKFRKNVKRYEKLKRRFLKDEQVIQNDGEDNYDSDSDKSEDLSPEELEEKYDNLNFKTQHTQYRDFLGKYDDEEFYIDENLHLFFPPLKRMRPSYTLMFRVIRLSGEVKISDKVVGWGVFPLINSELKVNQGRFKVPIVQGSGSRNNVQKYRDIEYGIKGNIDKWLCNMYFEINPLVIKDVKIDFKLGRILYKKPLEKRMEEVMDNNSSVKQDGLSSRKSIANPSVI